MATAKRTSFSWLSIMLGLAAAIIVAWWLFGDNARAYAQAGTGYAAKNACSCRHISGRELGSCRDDLISGMGLIMLSEDNSERSVTARVPLVASTTAHYRNGFGCVLEPWAS